MFLWFSSPKTWNAINAQRSVPLAQTEWYCIRVWVQRALPTIIYKQPLAKQMIHHRRVNSLDRSPFTPAGQLPLFHWGCIHPEGGVGGGDLGLMVSQGSHLPYVKKEQSFLNWGGGPRCIFRPLTLLCLQQFPSSSWMVLMPTNQ